MDRNGPEWAALHHPPHPEWDHPTATSVFEPGLHKYLQETANVAAQPPTGYVHTHTQTLSKPTYTSHLFRIQTVCVSGLLELNVSGCPWNVVSGLCQVQCPCLQRLDLSKVEDLKDTQLKELLATPHLAQGASGVPTGRFQKLLELGLAGTELTDASARLLIGHVPALKRLDLSHCGNISDQMLLTLTSPTSPLRERLTHISLAGRRGQWGWSHSSENHKLSHFTDSGRSLSYNSH